MADSYTSVFPSVVSLVTATTQFANTTLATKRVQTGIKQLFLAVAIIEIFLCLGGAAGNTLTFAAVIKNKKLQIVTNFYVVSLSIADLFVSVLVVPFRVVENFASYRLGYEWTLTGPLSEVVRFVGRTAQLVSLACLSAVSIDRLLALKFPMRYHTKIRHSTGITTFIIIVIWITCILLTCSPRILGIANREEELIIFVVYVFSVTLVICVSYFKIFLLMKKQSRNRRHLQSLHYLTSEKFEKNCRSHNGSLQKFGSHRISQTIFHTVNLHSTSSNERKPSEQVPSKPVPPDQLTTNSIPPDQVPLNSILGDQVPLNSIPPDQVPPNSILGDQVPPNLIPPDQVPPNQAPPDQVPPNQVPPDQVPSKQVFSDQVPSIQVPPDQVPSIQVHPDQLQMLPDHVPSNQLPPSQVHSYQVPPDQVPSVQVPPDQVSPYLAPADQGLPARVPSKQVPPDQVPPDQQPSNQIPPGQIPSNQVHPNQVPPDQVPPVQVPPDQVPPVEVTPDQVPPDQQPSNQISPDQIPSNQVHPNQVPPYQVLPVQVPPVQVPPVQVPLVQVASVQVPFDQVPSGQVPPNQVPPNQVHLDLRVTPDQVPPIQVLPAQASLRESHRTAYFASASIVFFSENAVHSISKNAICNIETLKSTSKIRKTRQQENNRQNFSKYFDNEAVELELEELQKNADQTGFCKGEPSYGKSDVNYKTTIGHRVYDDEEYRHSSNKLQLTLNQQKQCSLSTRIRTHHLEVNERFSKKMHYLKNRSEDLKNSVKEQSYDVKVALTIAMVIGAFVALVYPRIIFILYHTNRQKSAAAMLLAPWLRVLLYTNIVCNPLLYAWRLEQFRREFKHILVSCC